MADTNWLRGVYQTNKDPNYRRTLRITHPNINWGAGNDGATMPGGTPASASAPVRRGGPDYNVAKQAIEEAYQKGQMSKDEYNAYQTKAFESTRAQFANLRRRTVAGGYGRVNTGALQGRLQGVDVAEIGALGKGRTDINLQRAGMSRDASRFRASSYLNLMRTPEVYRPQVQQQSNAYNPYPSANPNGLGPEPRISTPGGGYAKVRPSPRGGWEIPGGLERKNKRRIPFNPSVRY